MGQEVKSLEWRRRRRRGRNEMGERVRCQGSTIGLWRVWRLGLWGQRDTCANAYEGVGWRNSTVALMDMSEVGALDDVDRHWVLGIMIGPYL